MIILLLINILELLAIVYLLWILFEQVMNYEYLNDLHDNALNSLREIAKTSSELPCADYWCNCEKCNDDITNNGEKCMRKGLKRILEVGGE